MSNFKAKDLIKMFNLSPLPQEGGFFKQTWKSKSGTAIYYLITAESWSTFHILNIDEVWNFYAGDPIEQLQLFPDGRASLFNMGNDFKNGYKPQLICEAGIWQATKLIKGGHWALVGTSTSPPYNDSAIKYPMDNELEKKYPKHIELIKGFYQNPKIITTNKGGINL